MTNEEYRRLTLYLLLHVGVVAACRQVPFVALNYRSEVMDFCQSIGWERFCVSTENLDPDQILDFIEVLADTRDEYSSQLQQGTMRVRERLLAAVQRTVSALVGNLR